MDLNKRGMFFTIIVIVILSLFFLSYSLYKESGKRQAIKERVSTMNTFLFSIEKDLPRQLYISGYRTIFIVQNEVIRSGSYVSNINDTFNNAFFNGEVNGIPQEIMSGATFSDLQESIQEKSRKLNIDTTLSNPEITISQKDPWNIEFKLFVNLYMKDQSNKASWNKTEEYIAYIPIQGFEDPLYVINTNALVPNIIQQTPYTIFVESSDVSNLLNHSINSYYLASTTAPSFLDRLQGFTSPNENGIESLVNLQKISSEGLQTQDKSVVDYIYFSSNNPTSCNVQPTGMPFWFKLDSAHLNIYGVQCN